MRIACWWWPSRTQASSQDICLIALSDRVKTAAHQLASWTVLVRATSWLGTDLRRREVPVDKFSLLGWVTS